MRFATLAVAALAVGLSGCFGDQKPADDASTSDPWAAPYALAAAEACLRARGASVQPLRPRDAQLRALRDLAQRRSLEVHIDGALVGAAVAPDAAGAELLVELLQLPNSPYEIVRRGNVVVLRRPADADASRAVLVCLED